MKPFSYFGEDRPKRFGIRVRWAILEMRSIPHSINSFIGKIEMTIDKSRPALLALAIFAISSISLTSGSAAVAKPTIHPDARNHEIHPRNHGILWTPELSAPAAQRPINDPFADMVLG
jgi:hypothetical protein